MRLLGISGSLRRASINTALLRAAAERLPEEDAFELAEIGDLPLYDSDIEDPERLAPVERIKRQVSAADAVLVATPEYNYGIPGPLKNAIDWASRPAYQSPFAGKPVGVLGAAPGLIGTARAQGQLKQVLLGMAAQVFPFPEFAMGQAKSKLDEQLALTDAATLELLDRYLASFREWARRVAPPPAIE